MSFASRLITALLGLALVFLFWPIGMPVGFQQAWWARQQVVTQVTPPPPAVMQTPPTAAPEPSKQLFTKPANPTPQPQAAKTPHAVDPKTPKTQQESQAKTKPEQTAALKQTDAIAITPPLKSKRYYRVVVRDGGTIEANGVVITLDDINTRDADAQCKDANGRTWACGMRAHTALTRLIRGRAVVCKVPTSGKQKTLSARCTVGGIDLSTWMVTQGWAKPKAPKDPKLAKAAEAARKKKIGLWR